MADTSTGWVKLFRSFTKWEWYTEPNVMRVYLHLLLTANTTDCSWQGIELKQGQIVTSYRHLAEAIGLDVHVVHRAINKLKSTGEITTQSNAKNTIITLNNYSRFQNSTTPKQRRNNTSTTTAQSNKNIIINNNTRIQEDTPAALSPETSPPQGKRLERRF